MICDYGFNFGIATIANSNTATVSPYVLDAGSAKKLFDGTTGAKVAFSGTFTADDNVTVRCQLCGADDAALTSNVLVLADSGVIAFTSDGSTALGTSSVVRGEIVPSMQLASKRYYGLLWTLGGTNPDHAASEGMACLALDTQQNMRSAKAATP